MRWAFPTFAWNLPRITGPPTSASGAVWSRPTIESSLHVTASNPARSSWTHPCTGSHESSVQAFPSSHSGGSHAALAGCVVVVVGWVVVDAAAVVVVVVEVVDVVVVDGNPPQGISAGCRSCTGGGLMTAPVSLGGIVGSRYSRVFPLVQIAAESHARPPQSAAPVHAWVWSF